SVGRRPQTEHSRLRNEHSRLRDATAAGAPARHGITTGYRPGERGTRIAVDCSSEPGTSRGRFARDLRFAARLDRRTAVCSGIATLVLAVTIAVATAVFSLYSHLALQPVEGVRGADRLVSIGLARDTSEWIPFSREQYTLMADALTVPETLVATSVPFVRNV